MQTYTDTSKENIPNTSTTHTKDRCTNYYISFDKELPNIGINVSKAKVRYRSNFKERIDISNTKPDIIVSTNAGIHKDIKLQGKNEYL